MQGGRKELIKQIASERIAVLFGLAEDSAEKEPELSHRYIRYMKEISSHYKATIPKKMRGKICTHCNVILVPGKNTTVRIVSSRRYVAYKCNKCGRETHTRY